MEQITQINFLFGIIAAVCFPAAALIWCWLSRPNRASDWVIYPFVYLTAEIVLVGFILSAFNRIASELWWGLTGLALFLLAVGVSFLRRPLRRPSLIGWSSSIGDWWRAVPRWEKRILKVILATVALTGLLNAGIVLFSAPHTWDNLAYRLARVAYYLQHGNLGYYDANYVQQIAVQKNCSILMLFSMIVSGRNENLTQIWQFLAYWTAAACVFGIAREIGLKRSASLLAAGVFALLTVSLMQSTTTQSDMLLAAFAGCVSYSLLAYRRRPRFVHLAVSAIAFGLGLGVKASFSLFIPSFLLIAAFVFLRRKLRFDAAGLSRFGLLVIIAVMVLALPAAYRDNYRLFNHPLGPEEFRRKNSYEGEPLSFILSAGAQHLVRHGFDFISLDGLPALPAVWNLQNALRYPFRRLTGIAGLELDRDLRIPWFYFPPPHSHEDYSSWGVLGWAVVWPVLLLALGGIKRRRPAGMIALAALVFIVVHAFSGVYDFGGRARYLLPATVLALPAAGLWFYSRSKALKAYLGCFIVLGCVSAVTAVLFRYRTPVIVDQYVFFRGRLTMEEEKAWPPPVRTKSVFSMDRLTQVLRDAPIFEEAIRNYERLVPPDSSVAAAVNPNSLEYLLFGRRLAREIIPINSFHRGTQPVPPEADFLLWADDFDQIFNRADGDIHLGKDWWLRRLR